jgi:hypothetical protein
MADKKKKVIIKEETVDLYHISPIHINNTAEKILSLVDEVARVYEFNKHGKKKLEIARLTPRAFKSVLRSVNSALKKSESKKIVTNQLVYNGISILPTRTASQSGF